MSQPKILIIDDLHQSILPMLTGLGYEPIYSPQISKEEIYEIISDFEGLILRSKLAVDKKLIEKAKKLKFVARAGAGMEKVDIELLKEKNIQIINAPEGNKDALAEHTLGMLLSILHKINASNLEVKKHLWRREENRGIELRGKTVGIYGVGNMGYCFAEKLASMGCEVIGYDKYKTNFSDEIIQEVSLEELMQETEILSIHVPLKEDTELLFDDAYLSKFKKLKILINTSRGNVLKTADLVKILENGKVYGAALDVLENEKPQTFSEEEKQLFDKLLSLPNVLVTPHIAGWTYESYEGISEVIAEKIANLYVG